MPTEKHTLEWERRFRARGGRHVSVRMCGRAGDVMDRLMQAHNCTQRDVIEGLLLGTIDAEVMATATNLGVSPKEAAEWLREQRKVVA